VSTYLRSKTIGDLTAHEAEECRRLTFGKRGEMQKLLDRERRHSKPPFCALMPPSHRTGRAVMLRDRSTDALLAWALIIYCSGEPSAHFFVAKEHRRRGLGRILSRHVQRFAPAAYCFPPNRGSRAFFHAVGANVDPGYLAA
jgi:GNAT superfamily N-acetyltransferase